MSSARREPMAPDEGRASAAAIVVDARAVRGDEAALAVIELINLARAIENNSDSTIGEET